MPQGSPPGLPRDIPRRELGHPEGFSGFVSSSSAGPYPPAMIRSRTGMVKSLPVCSDPAYTYQHCATPFLCVPHLGSKIRSQARIPKTKCGFPLFAAIYNVSKLSYGHSSSCRLAISKIIDWHSITLADEVLEGALWTGLPSRCGRGHIKSLRRLFRFL